MNQDGYEHKTKEMEKMTSEEEIAITETDTSSG